jgi:hypothetical protein
MQSKYPTRDQADAYLADYIKTRSAGLDANDLLYAVDASRNYDPSSKLEQIVAPVMFVNSADDFINPPELGIAQREITRVKRGKFVLLPISDQTRGHGTHTVAAVWKQYLAELLSESGTNSAATVGSVSTAPAASATSTASAASTETPSTCVTPPSNELKITKYVEPRFAGGAITRGSVILSGTVDDTGHLHNLDVVTGHPFIAGPIIDAASQWIVQTYCPAGKPVNAMVLLSTDWKNNQLVTDIRVDTATKQSTKKPHR